MTTASGVAFADIKTPIFDFISIFYGRVGTNSLWQPSDTGTTWTHALYEDPEKDHDASLITQHLLSHKPSSLKLFIVLRPHYKNCQDKELFRL